MTAPASLLRGLFVAVVLFIADPTHAAESVPATSDILDARHSAGVQVGGSGFAQLAYRLRLFSHSYLELGLGFVPGAVNESIGILVAHATQTRLFPYASAGVGFATLTRHASATDDMPWTKDDVEFYYVRAGAGLVLDSTNHISLGLDVGTWIGNASHSRGDSIPSSSRRIVWPMAGFSAFLGF